MFIEISLIHSIKPIVIESVDKEKLPTEQILLNINTIKKPQVIKLKAFLLIG